jgi:hypothetical protein
MPLNVVVSGRQDCCPDTGERYGFPVAFGILLMDA